MREKIFFLILCEFEVNDLMSVSSDLSLLGPCHSHNVPFVHIPRMKTGLK